MKLVAEISSGELVDKITILEIKLERIFDPSKRCNIQREYDSLRATFDSAIDASPQLDELRRRLRTINVELWRIEDEIRGMEQAGDFGADFIALARAVYRSNDLRAEIKRKINLLTNSELIEEKGYARRGL